jgi:hypothetical protein
MKAATAGFYQGRGVRGGGGSGPRRPAHLNRRPARLAQAPQQCHAIPTAQVPIRDGQADVADNEMAHMAVARELCPQEAGPQSVVVQDGNAHL